MNLKPVGQREIVIRLSNLSSNTNGVMLPCWEAFEGFVLLSRSGLLRGDVDHLPSRRIQIGRALISHEFQPLDDVFEFDLNCHTYYSILCGITPLRRVGFLRKPFCCPCLEPSGPEWRVECAFGLLRH